MIFVMMISPIITELTEVIINWLEVVKLWAVQRNTKIAKEIGEEPAQVSYAIGFHTPDQEEMYEEDDIE